MNNPYSPPGSPVADMTQPLRAGWLRIILAIFACSLLALFLSWGIAPILAHLLTIALGLPSDAPGPVFLAFDILFSCAAVAVACLVATSIAPRRAYITSLAIAAVGWIVYFTEVGGLSGIFSHQYPLWYEFFPTHIGPAVLVAFMVSRRRS